MLAWEELQTPLRREIRGTENATVSRKFKHEIHTRKVNRSSSKCCLRLYPMYFFCSWSLLQVLNRSDKALASGSVLLFVLSATGKCNSFKDLETTACSRKNMPKFLTVFRKNKYECYLHAFSLCHPFSQEKGQPRLYSRMGIWYFRAQWQMCPLHTDPEHRRERVGRFVTVTLDVKEFKSNIKRIETKQHFLL